MGILRDHSRKIPLYVATFVAVTAVGAVLVKPDRTAIGFVVWTALIAVSLLLLVAWMLAPLRIAAENVDASFK